MALITNLVAYWKLDESSGNAADSVGSNTLTNNGTASYSTGKINNAWDGGATNTTKWLTSTTNSGTIHQNMSFSFWVKMNTEITSGAQGFFTIRTDTSSNFIDWRVSYEYNAGTRRLAFYRSKPGVADQVVYYNITLGTTNWHHVVMTYDTATLLGYVAGSQVATLAASGVGTAGASTITIGATGASNEPASALIDEFGIWTRGLSSGEVTSLYYGGAGNQYPFTDPQVSDAVTVTENIQISVSGIHRDNNYSVFLGTPTTSHTFSYTCSGLNRLLFVATTYTGATVTGITYGGVAMTRVGSAVSVVTQDCTLFALVNPTLGANDVVITYSGSATYSSAEVYSYTGVLQSGFPDASTFSTTTGTSIMETVTTVADNCWAVLQTVAASGGNATAGTNSTAIITSGACFDNLGYGNITPAGSFSLSANHGTSVMLGGIMASFAPLIITDPRPSVSDTITATENIQISAFTEPRVVSVSDLITTTENVAIELVHIVSVFDSITISESFDMSSGLVVNDLITLTEDISVLIQILYVDIFDSINITENIQAETVTISLIFESISTSESINIAVIGIINGGLNDTITISESLSFYIPFEIPLITESITITENITFENITFSPQIPLYKPRGFAGDRAGYTIGGGL